MLVWMLAVGALCFGAAVTRQQLAAPRCPWPGRLLVLSRGEWAQLLALRLVPGDLFMLLATVSWAFYSWLLVRTSEPASIRGDWAAFLMAQMVFGLLWSGGFAGARMGAGPHPHHLGLAAGGGTGLHRHRAGRGGLPLLGGWACSAQGLRWRGSSSNLTPLFAALLSAAFWARHRAPTMRWRLP